MIIETMILAGASLVSGLCIGRACKKAKEPVINNHYGDVNNNTNSNNVSNSHNTNVDSHTDNKHHMNDSEEILSEIARLINDMEKERELKEMLKKNEEILNKYRK
jgi:hypothetical protein